MTDLQGDRLDDLFDALSHPVRRHVLQWFCTEDRVEPPVAVETLPVYEEGWVATELHHVHLPKLDAFGYLAWDPDRRRVGTGPLFHAVEPAVRLLAEQQHELPGDWP